MFHDRIEHASTMGDIATYRGDTHGCDIFCGNVYFHLNGARDYHKQLKVKFTLHTPQGKVAAYTIEDNVGGLLRWSQFFHDVMLKWDMYTHTDDIIVSIFDHFTGDDNIKVVTTYGGAFHVYVQIDAPPPVQRKLW